MNGYQTMNFYISLEVTFCLKDFVCVSGCLRYYVCIFCMLAVSAGTDDLNYHKEFDLIFWIKNDYS